MNEYLSMKQKQRQKIIKKIERVLSQESGVIFGFVFGSFLKAPSFRDIDVGIYTKSPFNKSAFDYELKLSKKLSDACGLPFDIFEVVILNSAPSSFLSNIFSNGKLLFSKNNRLLSDIIEKTSLDAIANEYIAYQSLKELVPT